MYCAPYKQTDGAFQSSHSVPSVSSMKHKTLFTACKILCGGASVIAGKPARTALQWSRRDSTRVEKMWRPQSLAYWTITVAASVRNTTYNYVKKHIKTEWWEHVRQQQMRHKNRVAIADSVAAFISFRRRPRGDTSILVLNENTFKY